MFDGTSGFQVPCRSFERAARFYAALLRADPKRRDVLGVPHAVFAAAQVGDRATVVQRTSREAVPAPACLHWGTTSVEDLRSTVERAWHAGGRVVIPVTAVGELGYIALVEDTEGNSVSLHAPRA